MTAAVQLSDVDLSELRQLVLAMAPDELRAWCLTLDEDEIMLVERAMTDEEFAQLASRQRDLDWRQDPCTFAHHLTNGEMQLWPYAVLLGQSFRLAVDGVEPRQMWWLPSQYGKPVSVDALVLMSDGSRRRLGDIEVGEQVIGHSGRACRVLKIHEQGALPVLRVRAHSGRSVLAAYDHPFLTTRGFVNTEDLIVGDIAACVGEPMTSPYAAEAISKEEFRLAGYFVGDGCCVTGSCSITCPSDDAQARDIERCADRLGFGWRVYERDDRPYTWHLKGGARKWLRTIGLAGHGSLTKRVPEFVFAGSSEQIGHFVGAYFGCDGSVWASPLSSSRSMCVEFYSISRDLLLDVQHLLLRLGIRSAVRQKKGQYKRQIHESWRLSITSEHDVALFSERVFVAGKKREQLDALHARRRRFDESLLGDEIVAIEPAGEAECRCLEVENDHTFTVNDFVVHNTTWLMWCVLWLLDRDPTKRIMYVSYDANKAVDEGRKARDLAMRYANMLNFRVRRDRRARGMWGTDYGGGLYCTGINGAITGFPEDVVLGDDLIKGWKTADSPVERDNIHNIYKTQMRMRVQSSTDPIILCGTRWNEDDVSERLLVEATNDADADQWHVVRLPAVAEETDSQSEKWWLRLPDPLKRKPGEVLEARRFAPREVRARAAGLGHYAASGLEQQRPSSPEGHELKREWWQWETTLPTQFDLTCTSWDMKLKDKQSGDFVVGQAWGKASAGYWLRDQFRGQWDFPTTCNAIALMAVRFPDTTLHLIENTGNGPEVIEALERKAPDYVIDDDMAGRLGIADDERSKVQRLRRRGMSGLVPVNPKGDKTMRARLCSPILEARQIHVLETPAGLALVEEAAAFPKGHHDDMVDAWSQAITRLAGLRLVTVVKPRRGRLPSTSPAARQQRSGPTSGLPSLTRRSRTFGSGGPRRHS